MERVHDTYDLVIAGGGPAGIEALLQATSRGMRAVLLEREEAGAVIAATMSGKRFYHAYGRNAAPPSGLLYFPDRKIGSELVEGWKKQLAGLSYLPHTIFSGITQDAGGYAFATDKGVFRAPRMILATGTFTTPRKLAVPGEIDNRHIAYEFDYRELPMDKQMLVVGGGNSAVESALELSLDNAVTLVVRKPALAETVTERNRAELDKEVSKGAIKLLFETRPVAFAENVVTLDCRGKTSSETFDRIYVHIGYEKPEAWLRSLDLSVGPLGFPALSQNLETSRANIFVAGALAGSDSIVGSANQAIEIVERITHNA